MKMKTLQEIRQNKEKYIKVVELTTKMLTREEYLNLWPISKDTRATLPYHIPGR